MESITLNEIQINNLLTNKSLLLDENKVLEIYNNELILNKNGYTNRVLSINIQFEKHNIENKKVIDFIRNLICEYLNLEPCEVIFFSRYQDEFQFKARTGASTSSKIIVYERRKIEGVNVGAYNPVTKTIGPYKQLSDSAYFFRWLNE